MQGPADAPAGGKTPFCVKMRASLGGRHVSGAERIAAARD
ncbi:MAG: hypothetical protein IJ678_07965, partial [Kiritimatiellae bacterium]|nr:hypothetical protein [Kiritimatiellia bacterium]